MLLLGFQTLFLQGKLRVIMRVFITSQFIIAPWYESAITEF